MADDFAWPSSAELAPVSLSYSEAQPTPPLEASGDAATLIVVHHRFGGFHSVLLFIAKRADVAVRDLKRYIARGQRDDRKFAPLEALEVVALQEDVSTVAADGAALRSFASRSEDPSLSSLPSVRALFVVDTDDHSTLLDSD